MVVKRKLTEAHEIRRLVPVNFADIEKNTFLHTTEKVGPGTLYEVANAFISPYGVVFRNGVAMKESFLNHKAGILKSSATFYKKIFTGKVRRVKGRCLVIHNVFYDNYYHWTIECLPRLFCVREEAKSLKLVIPERLLPFHRFYLELFAFQDIIYVKEDELIRADSVSFPSHITPEPVPHERIITELAAYILTRLSILKDQPTKSVFISREMARYRHAVNESEVWTLFKNYGFEKACMEELSVRDQIMLLTRTKKLSGIHGAGFSNLMYMTQGELFMDIMHREYLSNGFYNLASAHSIRYLLLQCNGAKKEKDPRTDDLVVDIPKLEQYLNSYFV
jgi:capsular polysaccharide biosynthesis protein